MPIPAIRYGASSSSASGAPVVTSVAPSSGPTTGGTVVTVLGQNFTGASQVLFGSIPATSFSASANSLTATAPVLPGGASPATISAVGYLNSAYGNGINSATIAPTTVGHLLVLVVVGIQGIAVNSITGGGVTTWTRVIGPSTPFTGADLELWTGIVTSVGASTVTANYGSSVASDYVGLAAWEFSASSGTATAWNIGSTGAEAGGSSTSLTFPNFTPSYPGQLYFGYGATEGVTGVAGSTTGYTYRAMSDGDLALYNPNITAASMPTATVTPAGFSGTVGVIIYATSSTLTVPEVTPNITVTTPKGTSATSVGDEYTYTFSSGSYSCTLTATATSVTTGGSTTLTASAPLNLFGTPYNLSIVDSITGAVLATGGTTSPGSNPTTCSVTITEASAQTRRYISVISLTGQPTIEAASSPVVVVWSGATVIPVSVTPHIMLITMDNVNYSDIIGSPNAPNLNTFVNNYASCTNAYGWEHPTLGNYLTLASGSDFSQSGGSNPAPPVTGITSSTPTIFSQLDTTGIPWRAYFENMPSAGYNGADAGGSDGYGNQFYVQRHNPGPYFPATKGLADYAGPTTTNGGFLPLDLNPWTNLINDLNAASPPCFVWVTPNMVNNMSDGPTLPSGSTNPQVGDSWLGSFVAAVQTTSWYTNGGVIIVTWGEANTADTSSWNGTPGGGHVPTVVISAATSSNGNLWNSSSKSYTLGLNTAGVLRSLQSAYGLTQTQQAAIAANGSIDSLVRGQTQLGFFVPTQTPAAVSTYASGLNTNAQILMGFGVPNTTSWTTMTTYNSAWTGMAQQLVYALPMCPQGQTPATAVANAGGVPQAAFTSLASTLVSAGHGSCILRLGYEFNNAVNAWSTNPTDFIAAWKQIYTWMMGVSGAHFQWDWNFLGGVVPAGTTLAQWYPGDAYVTYIGVDQLSTGATTLNNTYPGSAAATTQFTNNAANNSLTFAAQFASTPSMRGMGASGAKLVSIPQWAVAVENTGSGTGDDPTYVNLMYQWILSHDVGYVGYWGTDAAGDGRHDIADGYFPNARVAFIQDWGQATVAPPVPTVSGLSPTSGSASGGTAVTVLGTNFYNVSSVKFGTAAATGISVVNGGSLTCTAPAGTGAVNVTVTTPSGTSAAGPQFTYSAQTPTLNSAVVNGTSVTLNWTNPGTPSSLLWTLTSPATQPIGRVAAGMCIDVNGNILMYGGSNSATSPTDDTWIYTEPGGTPTWTQQHPANSPGSFLGTSGTGGTGGLADVCMRLDTLASSATHNQVIEFSGYLPNPGGNNSNTTFSWNGTNWSKLSPATSPPARSEAAIDYDPVSGRIMVTCGSSLNDTWLWTGTTWVQAANVGTLPRQGQQMCMDPGRGIVVLFGGYTGSSTVYNDTWIWNGSTWTQQTPSVSPSARYYPRMWFDPTFNMVILYGGQNNATVLSDCFGWNGTTWVPITITNNAIADLSAAVYSPTLGHAIVNGGWNNNSGVPWGVVQTYQVITQESSTGITGDDVFRDGTLVAATTGPVSTYTDTNVPVGTHSYYVTAVTSSGQSPPSNSLNATIAPPPAPTITSVSPNTGTTSGGTSVIITGTNFLSGATVKFGNNSATGVTVSGSTQITCTSPAGSAGVVNVIVTTSSGNSTIVTADQYTYSSSGTPTPKVIEVRLESQAYANIFGPPPNSADAPNLQIMAANFVSATNAWAEYHPSLPNYMEGWFGTTFGISDDASPPTHDTTNINLGQLLTAAGIPWWAYAESLGVGSNPLTDNGATVPGETYTQEQAHHLPMAYASSPNPASYGAVIKDYSAFAGDLASAAFQYAYVVPELSHSGHNPTDTAANTHLGIQAMDTWLGNFMWGSGSVNSPAAGSIMASNFWATGGIVLLVMDESSTINDVDNYSGPSSGAPTSGSLLDGGPIPFLALSKALQGSGVTFTSVLGHAGVLRGVAEYFGLSVANLLDANNPQYGDILPLLTHTASTVPTVTALNPTAGASAGGTSVILTGTNFISGATVKFGTASATGVVINSATQITCNSPAGTANTTVNVTVTTTAGTSATGTGNQFTYSSSPPPTSAVPGIWVNSNDNLTTLGIQNAPSVIALDYGSPGGSGAANTYTGLGDLSGDLSNARLMLSIGACTAAQSTTIANYLNSNGQSNAIIRPMWEQNQNVAGFFPDWNQLAFPTAAGYIAQWKIIYNAFKAVSPNFKFFWCPNAGDGNNAPGRTTTDTFPGVAFCDYVGLDVYDFSGYSANIQEIITFSKTLPLPMMIGEWGLNGSDDPTFMNTVATYVNTSSNNFAAQVYFSCSAADGCSIISGPLTSFPNSLAAYKAAFG